MKKIVVGILAHVDAGKTTLSESLLYVSGKIGKLGRVDNRDAYLDTFDLERERGITIFSKQAIITTNSTQITLLDTPGHVDFSAEMERTLQVLDYAILVISGADGVQGHTKTLWRLLDKYRVPLFIFINKMDQPGTSKINSLNELKQMFGDGCIDFEHNHTEAFYDQLSMCNEAIMESFLETGHVDDCLVQNAISRRQVFPCFFGSALKLIGIDQLFRHFITYTQMPVYSREFGCKVFKITRDDQGNRLTHMKITGGNLKVKDLLTKHSWEEKVNQIRIYSGVKYETVNEIEAGSICAVTGLTHTRPGEGLGIEKTSHPPILEPVLSYRITLPEGIDARASLPMFRQIEDEEPELNIIWDEHSQEIHIQLMGEIQMQILQSIIKSRFSFDIGFDAGKIVYKETITNTVEGVGHFEPLRHYAEVHLLLEPGLPGSGLLFDTKCSEDLLGKSWQRLVLTHLEEKNHKGVLTGSFITDMKITLVLGKSHNKHTQGGDFREATYRALRQGLKKATSILLEPFYSFTFELPEKMVGRAIHDISMMHGSCEITHTDGEMVVLRGQAPVATMKNYQQTVTAYTKGAGKLFYSIKGYEPCHTQDEVIHAIGYDSERDPANPTHSVFCSQGMGFLVHWDEVDAYMHLESYLKTTESRPEKSNYHQFLPIEKQMISEEEIESIMSSTSFANQSRKQVWKKPTTVHNRQYSSVSYVQTRKNTLEKYLLVDGYNIIHAWSELKDLVDENMESARMKLLDILSNYQGMKKCHIIVVFDAYRVLGHREEILDYHNIHLVYTGEAQTADHYIERFAHVHKNQYAITVATSDGLQQMIVRSAGCALLSARELKDEIESTYNQLKTKYQNVFVTKRNKLREALKPEIEQQMVELSFSDHDNNDKRTK